MKRIAIEIMMIIVSILLLLFGLILILTYLDGRLLIGIALMAGGVALWSVILRSAICQKQ